MSVKLTEHFLARWSNASEDACTEAHNAYVSKVTPLVPFGVVQRN